MCKGANYATYSRLKWICWKCHCRGNRNSRFQSLSKVIKYTYTGMMRKRKKNVSRTLRRCIALSVWFKLKAKDECTPQYFNQCKILVFAYANTHTHTRSHRDILPEWWWLLGVIIYFGFNRLLLLFLCLLLLQPQLQLSHVNVCLYVGINGLFRAEREGRRYGKKRTLIQLAKKQRTQN